MAVVSIVVRTRGRAFFLRRALASIAEQRDTAVEVVVVNDGGERRDVEEAAGAARTAGLVVQTVHHDTSRGRGAAWNAAWRVATGEWLAALDDDDTWAPHFLGAVREEMAAKLGGSSFGVVTQTLEIRERADGAGWVETERKPYNPLLREAGPRELVLLNRFTNNAFVFPRAALDVVGWIREDVAVLEDWDFNARFAARFPIRVVPRPLAHYHRREETADPVLANTALARHLEVRHEILAGWLRDDLSTGRFGLGALSVLAELESNRGLQFFNRLAAWWQRKTQG